MPSFETFTPSAVAWFKVGSCIPRNYVMHTCRIRYLEVCCYDSRRGGGRGRRKPWLEDGVNVRVSSTLHCIVLMSEV